MNVVILGKPERNSIFKKLSKLVRILDVDIDEEIRSLADIEQVN